jgi:hypothetical protein
MAEVDIPRNLFAAKLERIQRLSHRPKRAWCLPDEPADRSGTLAIRLDRSGHRVRLPTERFARLKEDFTVLRRQWLTVSGVARCTVFAAVASVVTIMPGCGTTPGPAPAPGSAAAPVITPDSTIFFGSVEVAMTTSTPDAEICYTTDDSTPTLTHGVPYAGAIELTRSATVKAAAYLADGTISDVSSARFTRIDHAYGVWGSSPTNVWVVGGFSWDWSAVEAEAARYDGDFWSSAALPVSAGILSGVWGSSDDDVFAVGTGGTIVHYDGTSWSSQASGTTEELNAVWGTAGDDVFAVGSDGTILHYNGAVWSAMVSGVKESLTGVYGLGPNAIMAVGSNGTILTYDGAAWGAEVSNTNDYLFACWGSTATNAYAVGTGGTIVQWNGVAWNVMVSGTTEDLRGVWGVGAEVFAVGSRGTILHYEGAAWSAMASGTMNPLQGIWGGSSSDNVFVVGQCGTILHYDGIAWSQPWGDGANCAW